MNKILISFNILLYLTSVLLWIVVSDNFLLNIATSAFTILFTIVLFFSKKKELTAFLLARTSKRLYTELTTLFLVFLVLVFSSYLVYKNPYEIDISSQKINSLSEQSIAVVKKIQKPIQVKVFSKRDQWEQILAILNFYSTANSQIKVQAIDVETSPHLVQSYELKEFPAVVVEDETNKIIVKVMDELNLTNAFLKVIESKEYHLVYSTGHGELNLDEYGDNGGSFLREMMKNSHYHIEQLHLAKISALPSHTDLLMIIGAQDGFLDHELSMIEKYLESGGKLLISLNPDFKGDRLSKLRNLLQKWGIKISNDIVVDQISTVHGADATIPIVEKYTSQHRLMKDFTGTTIFPMTSSIELVSNEKEMSGEILVHSSPFPASWAEKNLEAVKNGKAVFDNKDAKGPAGLVVLVAETGLTNELKTKILAFASSSFILNGYASQGPNFNLFLNGIGWLIGNEGLISLNRPMLTNERIMMSSFQLSTIFYFSVIFLPILCLILSFYFYRRKLKL